jgi:hypothetical protein
VNETGAVMNLPRANWPVKSALSERPLIVGDRCRLFGGSPTMLVVQVEDADLGDDFMVAWKNPCGVAEYAIDRDAVRRCAE